MGVFTTRRSAHDADSLERWLADGYDEAYRVAWLVLHDRADAEEAVQEAFLRAWRFRDAIPAGTGVRPWLHRVVVNACLSRLRADRSRGLHLRSALAGVDPAEPADRGPDERLEAAEAAAVVADAVADLPEHLRVVVVLRYFAQLSEREIAEVIRRRPGTVKSRLHEAKARLGADARLAAMARPADTSTEVLG